MGRGEEWDDREGMAKSQGWGCVEDGVRAAIKED